MRKNKIINNEVNKNAHTQANTNRNAGITLIALVIIIIIIIILASITINFAFGDNGLINMAEEARDLAANSTDYESNARANLVSYMNEFIADLNGGSSGGGTDEPEDPTPPEPEKSEIEQARDEGTVFETDTPLKDENDNVVVVPEGFKVAEDSGDTVQQGIVIEDVSASDDANVQGSQFVWIPVGTLKKDDKTEVEITLGRYTFDESTGEPHLEQAAYTESNPTNYESSVVIEDDHSEIAGEHRDGVASNGKDGLNATAKNLAEFVDSVRTNGGYYIGRYEASFASGTSENNYKAASKVSTAHSTSSMSHSKGTLWNFITQLEASKVAINTYNGTSVESDLMNSYAWDTAIVYIQEATGLDYANETSVNSSLTNTGTTSDEVCKINDMASNLYEWTTEYSSYSDSSGAYPCTRRGGNCYSSSGYTARRSSNGATSSFDSIGFRLSIYL